MDYILAHCANVDDAIALFKKYNLPALERAKFPIADASGASIVVEWGQGKLQIIRNSDWYQISTNFVQTNFKPEDYPCNRFPGHFKSSRLDFRSRSLKRGSERKGSQEGRQLR